jgi:Arc/MetJ-type ribon-helix-helix transcriptional regulator
MAQDDSKRGTALSVKMPMAMAQAVYQQVRSGAFDSAGAVIREALRQFLKLDEDDEAPRRDD